MVDADHSWSARILIACAAHAARLASERGIARQVALSTAVHGKVVSVGFVMTPVSIPGGRDETAARRRLAATL